MDEARKNRLGSLSLAGAIAGFLLVELQPWLPLESVALFGGLSLKGLLEAFFEASLAGAVADWFAVTALFRDPVGVRLPHTNILAKSKDSIAAGLPRFLQGFVSLEAISTELRRIDFAGKIADELSSEGSREGVHDFLRRWAGDFFLAIGGGDEERAASFERFSGQLLDLAADRLDAPKELGSLLVWAEKEGFAERAVEAFAEYARLEIGRNRSRIVAMATPILKRGAGWKGLFIGSGTVEGLVVGLEDELAEMKSDRGNELRRFLLQSVSSYADRLSGGAAGSSPEGDALAASFRDTLADPSFRSGFARFLGEIAQRVGEDLSGEGGRFIPTLERIEDAAAARLRSDEELRSRLNEAASALLLGVIERGRLVEGVAEYLASLLKATDEKLFVERIEAAVWNDLQYIRLNGAVVGGLVGLVIALAKAAFGG